MIFQLNRTIILAGALGLFSAAAQAGWGAIAIVDEQGMSADDVGYATAEDHPTEAEARARAMSDCRKTEASAGNKASACRVPVTFRMCGAYAVSKTRFGVGTGKLISQAEQQAIQTCGGTGCTVVVSTCNTNR